jgi:hypothetical protein
MSSEITKMGDSFGASASYGGGATENVGMEGVYVATCYDANGNEKWSDTIENLTTNVGRASLNDAYLGNTAAGAVVMGLGGANGSGTFTPAYADTQASHAGWFEVGGTNAPTYSGTRKTPTFSASTSANPAVKSTSAAVVFSMTGSGTVYGAFINVGGSTAIDNTTGTLFSIGAFTAGSKTVTSGDTINVTYTLSAAG